MCMWGYLNKYIRVAAWPPPPKQKFLAPPLYITIRNFTS